MTIRVELLSATRVYIVSEPSITARIVYRKQTERRLAIRRDGYWAFTAPAAGWVGLQLEAEIDDALSASFRTPYSAVRS